MKLFEEKKRNDRTARKRSETWFTLLDRSSIPEVQRTRELLEEWFAIFPESSDGRNKIDLSSTFRNTKDDRGVLSAFFELYCHALLHHQGFTCEARHHTKDPNYEFRVFQNGTPVFCMECVTVSGMSNEEYNIRKTIDFIYDELDERLGSPNFFIAVSVEKEGSRMPAVSNIIPALEKWLAGLDPDEAAKAAKPGKWLTATPAPYRKDVVDDGGWHLSFVAIPKKNKARGEPGSRPIGMEDQGFKWVRTADTLRKRLTEKAKKYGALDLPYIIAVNVTDMYADSRDVSSVLVGTEGIHDLDSSGEYKLTEVRLRSFWHDAKKPRKTQVSAVLSVVGLFPDGIAKKSPLLWLNPWAEKKLDPAFWRAATMRIEPQNSRTEPITVKEIPGMRPWGILGLHSNWPYEE